MWFESCSENSKAKKIRQSYLEAFETTQLQMQRELKGLRRGMDLRHTHTYRYKGQDTFEYPLAQFNLYYFQRFSKHLECVYTPPSWVFYLLHFESKQITIQIPTVHARARFANGSARHYHTNNNDSKWQIYDILTKVDKGGLSHSLEWWICRHDFNSGEVPILWERPLGRQRKKMGERGIMQFHKCNYSWISQPLPKCRV